MGSKAGAILPIALPQDILVSAKAGQLFLYIFGRATYHDMIAPEVDHLTRICYEIPFIPIAPTQQAQAISFAPLCAIHNCADEECAREDREHPEAAPQ